MAAAQVLIAWAPIDTNEIFRNESCIKQKWNWYNSQRFARDTDIGWKWQAMQKSEQSLCRYSPSYVAICRLPSKLVFISVVDVHFKSFRTVVVAARVFFCCAVRGAGGLGLKRMKWFRICPFSRRKLCDAVEMSGFVLQFVNINQPVRWVSVMFWRSV